MIKLKKNERDALSKLCDLSQNIGSSSDIIQGGGGNTSLKLNDCLMAVKASGFFLKNMSLEKGYVIVDYCKIREYFSSVLPDTSVFQRECSLEINQNVVYPEMEDGVLPWKPSIEAGFHSLLGRCVIHSHSVYTNILNCCYEGKVISEQICAEEDADFFWVPYCNPGGDLTLQVRDILAGRSAEASVKILFLQNHGLIVSATDLDSCKKIHDRIQQKIISNLKIDYGYPDIKVTARKGGGYFSDTEFIREWQKNGTLDVEIFFNSILYPDQIVYLNNCIIRNEIIIDSKNGTIQYDVKSWKEAKALEETLVAYLYVLKEIDNLGLTMKTLNKAEAGFISGWDEEEYRKKIMREKG